ncbi:hypothetical protein D3273_23380 [Lichenibacterium minor]|uniref:Uncharacterized protein n=1 Tax=Lichenibacterium minor TaxID=2316528 RepID=A0A4Q2TZT6_9HYPH|nr:hypothetical protein [Lichenibacterium minor]RYC29532.1 hypothetical protein D3273_23380 [Lichenibacterium minor]
MAAIPLDNMLWVSLGVWGLGGLFLLPIWWRNWRVKRGANLPIEEFDIQWQTVTRWLLLVGTLSTMSTLLGMASRTLPFPVFVALGIGVGCAGIAAAFAIDAARARRH